MVLLYLFKPTSDAEIGFKACVCVCGGGVVKWNLAIKVEVTFILSLMNNVIYFITLYIAGSLKCWP
jgi:hypothetical protein